MFFSSNQNGFSNPFSIFPTNNQFPTTNIFGQNTATNINVSQSNQSLFSNQISIDNEIPQSTLSDDHSAQRIKGFSSLDSDNNLFTSTQEGTKPFDVISLINSNPIEKELIESLSIVFNKHRDELNMSPKGFSNHIRMILKEKAQINERDYKPLLFLFSFFDFFIVNIDDLSYLFKIREELLFKYLSPDLSKFELFRNDHMSIGMQQNSIDSQIQKIIFLLLICDFAQVMPIIKSLINAIEISNVLHIKERFREYIDFFMQLGHLCENYYLLIKENNKGGNLLNCKSIMQSKMPEFILDMDKILRKINCSDHTMQNALSSIVLLLKGDIKVICQLINEKKLEWYFILLDVIFYTGYQGNFIQSLKTIAPLNESDSDKILLKILSNCQSGQFELIKSIKGSIPFPLYFALLTIIESMNLISVIDIKFDYYKYEYIEYLNYMFNFDISFEHFYEYYYGYVDSDMNTNIIFAHNFAVKAIHSLFIKDLEQNDLKNKIDNIKIQMSNFQNSNESLIILNRICFENYFHLNCYKEAIESYIQYKNYKRKTVSSSMICDDLLVENEDPFDVFFYLLLNGSDWEPLIFVSKWLREKKDLPKNVEFLWKYIDFERRMQQGNGEDYSNVLNEFFGYCFVLKSCPAIMWLCVLEKMKLWYNQHGLRIIKENVGIGLDNLFMYEHIIKRRMKDYYCSDNDEMSVDNLFRAMADFWFDQKTNMGDLE